MKITLLNAIACLLDVAEDVVVELYTIRHDDREDGKSLARLAIKSFEGDLSYKQGHFSRHTSIEDAIGIAKSYCVDGVSFPILYYNLATRKMLGGFNRVRSFFGDIKAEHKYSLTT